MKTTSSIKTIHAAFHTPENIIFELVKKTTSSTPVKRIKIYAGYDSEVYLVHTTDKRKFIVKVNHADNLPYTQEIWAMQQAKNNGVPVAEVLFIGSIAIDAKDTEVMVQTVVKGVSLASRRSHISPDQFSLVLHEAGEVLGLIHQVRVGGCWKRRDDGTWQYPTWQSLVKSMVDGRRDEIGFLLKGGLNEKHINQVIKNSELLSDTLNTLPLVLNHGDFMPEHIFIDEDCRITGIIDFGSFVGALPMHDFAFIMFFGPNIPLRPIIEGYGNDQIKNLENEIHKHALLLGLGHLAHNVKLDRKFEAKFCLNRITTLLERP